MKKLVLGLSLLGATSLFADYQLTLIDKDGVETNQCIKSYSFSNNLESLARKNDLGLKDVYSTEETLTNKIYLGKPVYRKVVNLEFDASAASKTNPIFVYSDISDNVEDVFVVRGKVKWSTGHIISKINQQTHGFTYCAFQGLNNRLEFRTYDSRVLSAQAVVEYTKTTDVVNSSSNTFKSYLHYVPSSSENEDVTTIDIEDKGISILKNYTYDSTTNSCTKN